MGLEPRLCHVVLLLYHTTDFVQGGPGASLVNQFVSLTAHSRTWSSCAALGRTGWWLDLHTATPGQNTFPKEHCFTTRLCASAAWPFALAFTTTIGLDPRYRNRHWTIWPYSVALAYSPRHTAPQPQPLTSSGFSFTWSTKSVITLPPSFLSLPSVPPSMLPLPGHWRWSLSTTTKVFSVLSRKTEILPILLGKLEAVTRVDRHWGVWKDSIPMLTSDCRQREHTTQLFEKATLESRTRPVHFNLPVSKHPP